MVREELRAVREEEVTVAQLVQLLNRLLAEQERAEAGEDNILAVMWVEREEQEQF